MPRAEPGSRRDIWWGLLTQARAVSVCARQFGQLRRVEKETDNIFRLRLTLYRADVGTKVTFGTSASFGASRSLPSDACNEGDVCRHVASGKCFFLTAILHIYIRIHIYIYTLTTYIYIYIYMSLVSFVIIKNSQCARKIQHIYIF